MVRPGRRRISQSDVAKAAGVSTGVVSSVINNRSYGTTRVSESTRQRVLDTVERLGYVPDIAARTMAGGSNRIIGVFTYEPLFPVNSENFYHEFLVGIEHEADQAEYNLLLLTGSRVPDRRSLFPTGVNGLRLADGGVLLGGYEDPGEIQRLSEEGYPFVYVGERHFSGVEPSYVGADYLEGSARVVEHLHASGHVRIGMVRTHTDPVPGRVAGFELARRRIGLSATNSPVLSLWGRGARDPARLTARITEILTTAQDRGLTALIVQGGGIAPEFWRVANDLGISIPRDLSVVDLSGRRDVLADGRDVSGLRIPRRDMGELAVRLLLRLVEDPSAGPLRKVLPCAVHEGQTIVAPRT